MKNFYSIIHISDSYVESIRSFKHKLVATSEFKKTIKDYMDNKKLFPQYDNDVKKDILTEALSIGLFDISETQTINLVEQSFE